MCALLDFYVPDKANYYSLDSKDTKHNAVAASNVMHDLGIPVYIDPDNIEGHGHIDGKALLIQISAAKVVLEKLSPTQGAILANVVSDFNQSTVTNSEAITEKSTNVNQTTIVDESNLVQSVETFNKSNQTFQEVVDDGGKPEALIDESAPVAPMVPDGPVTQTVNVDSETESSDSDLDDFDVHSRASICCT